MSQKSTEIALVNVENKTNIYWEVEILYMNCLYMNCLCLDSLSLYFQVPSDPEPCRSGKVNDKWHIRGSVTVMFRKSCAAGRLKTTERLEAVFKVAMTCWFSVCPLDTNSVLCSIFQPSQEVTDGTYRVFNDESLKKNLRILMMILVGRACFVVWTQFVAVAVVLSLFLWSFTLNQEYEQKCRYAEK